MSRPSRKIELIEPQWVEIQNEPPHNPPMTIVDFYSGTGVDPGGRTLNDILSWDVDTLDPDGHYVNTMFPQPEDGSLWGNGSVVDRQVFETFRNSSDLRARLNDAFKKILWSYGLEMVESEAGGDLFVSVFNIQWYLKQRMLIKAPKIRLDPRIKHHALWNVDYHRHHVRFPQIIRSLRVLGLEKQALAFYHVLTSEDSAVGEISRKKFEKTTCQEVVDEQDETIGERWLWEFIQKQKMVKEEE